MEKQEWESLFPNYFFRNQNITRTQGHTQQQYLQPCPQGFSLKIWVGQEKALASAGHVSPRTPKNPGCNKLALCEMLKLCVASQREILGCLLYLLTINKKFYKNSFLPQILAMIIFCFPPISMKGTMSINVKLLFIERYKWQTSYA